MNAKIKPGKTAVITCDISMHGFGIGEKVIVGGHHPEYVREDLGYINVYRCYAARESGKNPCKRGIKLVREYEMFSDCEA